MTFQQKLNRLIAAMGKTQAELAELLQVSVVTLNSWIHGKSTPRPKAQERIDLLFQEYIGVDAVDQSALAAKKKEINEYKKKFPNPLLHIIERKDIYDAFVLELTYHTNGIEGSTFTEPEVRAVLFDNVTIPDKTLIEHQEAKNHQAAFGNMMKWLQQSKKNNVITEKVIQQLHFMLMNGIRSDAGYYRRHGVRILGSHVPTANYLKISDRMQELITVFQAEHENELYAHLAKTHSQFEQIHPFSDGNGRVGRLLMHAMTLQHGLPPVLIKKEKKQAYYTYLQKAQVQQEYLFLESFICDGILDAYTLL